MVRFQHLVGYTVVALLAMCTPLGAQEPENVDASHEIQLMRIQAVAFLKKQRPHTISDVPSDHSEVGESAIIAHALIKAGVPSSDEHVAFLVRRVAQSAADGVFRPQLRGGRDNYEAGLACVALAEANADLYRAEIQTAVKYLQDKQKGDGSWDYQNGRTGDTSMTQMALLGLWSAQGAGVDVPVHVWDRAARWLINTQYPAGGFSYHPGERQVTHSMTAGALGSLYICQNQLRRRPGGTVTPGMIDRAVARGAKWFAENFTVTNPTGHFYYYFYSLERYAAFSEQTLIGNRDWYAEGVEVLKRTQGPAGAWVRGESYSAGVETAFALLFLVKATHGLSTGGAGRLGGGALLAGRGLPSDLSLLTVQRGRLVVPPIKVTLDQLLDHLRQGEADRPVQLQSQTADSKTRDELMQLARNPEPEVRERAIWTLGRLRRYEVVPVLIRALEDPDFGVRRQARDSLRQLSRKPDGFGLPDAPNADQIKQAVRKWTQWYQAVRPYDDFNASKPTSAQSSDG